MINERLLLLRNLMSAKGISAIVIPNSDPHNSEYMAPYWRKMTWISGFTGSAGTVVITATHAGLWTDSRYFLQAEQELLESEIALHKMGLSDKAQPDKWILENLSEGDVLAMTSDMWPPTSIRKYVKQLTKKNISVVTQYDLIGEIWKEGRPAIPDLPIFVHDVKYAGKSAGEKIAQVRTIMQADKIEWHLITTLDDIAWMCNLRGKDIPFNPVFLAYLLVGLSEARLYITEHKATKEMSTYLKTQGIDVRSYDRINKDLQELKELVLVNPDDCNNKLYELIPKDVRKDGRTITRWLKAIKNEVEQAHIERMMIKDGVALAHAFYWLDQNVDQQVVTEFDFAEKIAYFRSQQEGYYGESFPAIVGYKSNGAINHYRPHKETALEIKREGILLCDSGGQYIDGTSDITRTIAMGAPKEEEKVAFTLVLKGHISLDSIHYPVGTTGSQLDVLARQHLWRCGRNYGHGTGHGVGFFMNVHEPPQGYAPGTGSRATTALEAGMFSSNEPGYYKDGAYGIRIENLVIAQQSTYPGFLCHHNVTLYPLDISLIEVSLLSPDEIDWINDYHIKVYSALSPYLEGAIQHWFEKKCDLIHPIA